MITFNKYVNSIDHTWYNSSNLVYSACYDSTGSNKSLKVVFKGGRTYLYKDVSAGDYVMFSKEEAGSNGKAFDKYIVKKYKGVRLQDTDLTKLENLRKEFEGDNRVMEEAMSDLSYSMEINDATGEFRLKLNGKPIFEGVEGHVSIVNLLGAMHIAYNVEAMTTPRQTEKDFEARELVD